MFNTVFSKHSVCSLLSRSVFQLERSLHLSSTRLSPAVLDLSGVLPPITTPFKENEDINWKELQGNVSKYNNLPFSGYLVQGSNGEAVSLSSEERVDLIKFVREATPDNKLIIAGSGCEGTRETVLLTQKMADVGANAAMVVTPSFYKNRMNYDEIMRHYTAVSDASPVPIILYNVPSNTGIEMPLKTIVDLSKHPNIIGIKDSSGNITYLGSIIQETSSESFQVLVGTASLILPAIQLGAVGSVCALANVLGKECCLLYTLTKEQKFEEARKLQLSLIKPNVAVTRKYNVPAMKYAMGLLGYYGGPCRLPLTQLTEAESFDVRQSFHGFL